MTERVAYVAAAEILDCHVSNVFKLSGKGQLRSRSNRNRRLHSLERDPAFTSD